MNMFKYLLLFALFVFSGAQLFSQSFNSLNSETGAYLRGGNFINADEGFIFGGNGVIKKTSDKGATWELVNSPTLGTPWGGFFLNSEMGWISSDNGYFAKTEDGGISWVQKTITSYSNERITDVKFFNENIGYASGGDGHLFYTNNGGETWIEKYYEAGLSPIFFYSIYILSESAAFAAAGNSRIYRTTNSGGTWSEVNYKSGGEELNNLYFVGNTGYAVGDKGLILKSTNGGSSWFDISYATESELRGVYFIDENTGYISGNDGVLIKTENGGSSWSKINLGTTNTLYFMTGFSENVYLGGAGGSLYSNVVLPSTIEVVYPNGGEIITERTTMTIEWKASNFEGDVLIALNRNGNTDFTIGSALSINESFHWSIPDSLIEDSTYSIFISSIDDPNINDGSDSLFTIQPQRNIVSVDSNPSEGGNVVGAGEYVFGENVTLTAEPTDSYNFVNWTSNEVELATEKIFEFTIDRDTNIVANFVFDDSPAEITINFPEIISDTIGAEMDIPVYLDFSKSTEFESFEFELNYDPSIINIQSIVLDSSVIENFDTLSNRNQVGNIHFTGASSEVVSSEGLFLTLKTVFHQVGITNLEWSYFFFNEGTPIATPINGLIEVLDIPRNCGDVTNDGFVTNEDATWILRHGVKLSPQFPLIEEDSLAADVTANGWISAFDAAQVLKDVVGLNRTFNCDEPLRRKSDPLVADWDWNIVETTEGAVIPLNLRIETGELQAMDLEIDIPSGFNFSDISYRNSDWLHLTNPKEGKLYVSMIGSGIRGNAELGVINFTGKGDINQFKAEAHLNEQTVISLKNEALQEKPANFVLHQNYPNPFNPSTTISYDIPEQGAVQLIIYNALGQQVAVLENAVKQAGTYQVKWDASNNASGIYVYKITFANTVLTKKLMLIK